jgi:Asp-tRNA(Asn)/Glu-tRNA(Gln) amidotransferase A subunit family amidase
MLAFETLETLINKIKTQELKSLDVFEYFLKRVEKYDSKLDSFNYVNKNFSEKNNTPLF